ncbi:MAG: hypothetical protein ACRC2R_11270 [Xenococcaceae cyanobacterium]
MFQPDLIRGDTIASDDLLNVIRQKRRDIVIATPDSDEARLLDYFGVNASVNTNNINNILVRPDVRKIEILIFILIGDKNEF